MLIYYLFIYVFINKQLIIKIILTLTIKKNVFVQIKIKEENDG